MMARGSDYVARICGICTDLCDASADECAKFDSEACQACCLALYPMAAAFVTGVALSTARWA
jgi:hypothetical protein